MKDFEAGGIGFIFIMMQSSDMITISAMAPDPKQIKRKARLLLKARQEEENENPDNFFPTGIANEVVFMEITGKILANLYSSCQVRQFVYFKNFRPFLAFFSRSQPTPVDLNFLTTTTFWRFWMEVGNFILMKLSAEFLNFNQISILLK